MASFTKIEGTRGVRWKATVRRRGHPTQSQSFGRKTDAKIWAQSIEAKIDAGKFKDDSQARKHTVAELIDRYVSDVIPQKKSGEIQRYQLGRWKELLGNLRLSEMTPDRIVNARKSIMAQRTRARSKVSNATVNRYHAALSHVLRVAEVQYGWIDQNPMRKIPKLKEGQGRVRWLSDDERKALLKSCRESNSPYLNTIVMIALTTGMRRNEILSLTWGDVDLERHSLLIEVTKNGQRRSAALRGEVVDMLSRLQPNPTNAGAYVFPNKNGFRPIDFQSAWKTAMRRAELEGFRFHDLRHTTASYMALDGASALEIANMLGHKNLQMVARYAHLSPNHANPIVLKSMDRVFDDDG